jgi:methylmalonyl-CoA mutase N-terminal domain/subunit
MDETLALPSEKAAKIALRTQQLIAYETGVINTIDPLGGSYYVEALTDKMELECNKIFDQIDAIGGVIPAIETGYFQKEIADAAYRYQKEVEKKEKIIVGVNEFIEEDEKVEIPILTISPEVEIAQKKRLAQLKQSRSQEDVDKSLAEIKAAGENGNNLMPIFVKAAHNKVTLGEMVGELREVFGTYEEVVVF